MRVERIGRATLYLADCREVLPTLGGVDLVCSDPPYGIGYKHSGCAGRRGRWQHGNSKPIAMDDQPFDPRPFLVAPAILFGGDHFAPLLPEGGVFHVWDKECGRTNRYDSFSDAEIFWTSFPGKRRVIRYMWKGFQVEEPRKDQKRWHPTQKPVAVMRELLKMAPNAQTVLDPFMGVGTTALACIEEDRDFIGCEIDPEHFETACRRIREAVGEGAGPLFAEAAA